MAERLLPESIRGCWYYMKASIDPKDFGDKPPQVLEFRLDGSFTRYLVKSGEWTVKEEGDYTFDGSFLIIRGRNTDTFRVKPEEFWKWNLQAKKDDHKLLRGLIDEDDFLELSEEERKEIRILPIRVSVETPWEGEEVVYDLVFRPEEGSPRIVGNFFVERTDDTDRIWVGLSPYAVGIENKTWERIVRESYLDMYCGKPADVRVVTVRLLDSQDSRVFNYEIT